MEVTELSKKVSEKITDLYKYIHTVESCDAMINKIHDMKIVFQKENEDGGIDVVDVSTVLSENQMQNAKGIVIAMLNGNKEDANEVLKQFLAFEAKEKTVKFGDGQDDDEEEEELVEEEKKEVVLDAKKVKKLLDKGMTQKEIANEFGVSQGKVQRFIAQNGLKRKKQNTPS